MKGATGITPVLKVVSANLSLGRCVTNCVSRLRAILFFDPDSEPVSAMVPVPEIIASMLLLRSISSKTSAPRPRCSSGAPERPGPASPTAMAPMATTANNRQAQYSAVP